MGAEMNQPIFSRLSASDALMLQEVEENHKKLRDLVTTYLHAWNAVESHGDDLLGNDPTPCPEHLYQAVRTARRALRDHAGVPLP